MIALRLDLLQFLLQHQHLLVAHFQQIFCRLDQRSHAYQKAPPRPVSHRKECANISLNAANSQFLVMMKIQTVVSPYLTTIKPCNQQLLNQVHNTYFYYLNTSLRQSFPLQKSSANGLKQNDPTGQAFVTFRLQLMNDAAFQQNL